MEKENWKFENLICKLPHCRCMQKSPCGCHHYSDECFSMPKEVSLQKESEWEQEFDEKFGEAFDKSPFALVSVVGGGTKMISTELKSFISRTISDEITKNKCKLQHCEYPHDMIFPLIKKEIADAVSNREKEIAEEVEEIQTKLHNGHFEAGYKLTNKLLSILKH